MNNIFILMNSASLFYYKASILFFKKGLKEIWSNDRDLDSEEKFLRDFLLEKKYEVDELGR